LKSSSNIYVIKILIEIQAETILKIATIEQGQGTKDNIMSMPYGNRFSRFGGLDDLIMLVIGNYY